MQAQSVYLTASYPARCALLQLARDFCGLGFFCQSPIQYSIVRLAGKVRTEMLDESSPVGGTDGDIHVLCQAQIAAERRTMS
jgi:hypothetical protein